MTSKSYKTRKLELMTKNHGIGLPTCWRRLSSALLLSAGLGTMACGARIESEVGGKTSWLSACERDADCTRLDGAKCVQNLCTVECENDGCGAVEGTRCATQINGCFEAAACLPRCSEPSDCGSYGANYSCLEGACVLDSCVAIVAPDSAASDPGTSMSEQGTRSSDPAAGPQSSASGNTEFPSSAESSRASSSDTSSAMETSTTTSLAPDSGATQVTADCEQILSMRPSERPYATQLAEADVGSLEGEPACEGACGYVSVYNVDYDLEWRHVPALECPLDISQCEELQAALDASPPRCNTVDDCVSYSGSLALCEPVFDRPRYFDSALFTPEERATRDAIYLEMQQRGCRRLSTGWDGPRAEVGCIDNECQLVLGDHCGELPVPACDACAPDAGPVE